ncbi:permease [Cohnella sp. CFH 77786]|uniref:permease n=1 Tax=Cohnella sp. CFH 77786 TaxID=2662265 RepID=UPI001C60CD31|nr:permease [Cohnella sp. CFH 77786]MBW5447493.1 permease [Cohnella sp. CFH 77786]
MPQSVYRWTLNLLTAGCLIFLYLIFTNRDLSSLVTWFTFRPEQWQGVKTLFVSLFLEALPFILLGVLVSSALHLFVSDNALRRLIPAHPVPGVLLACLLGILLPVCECGMIPIVRGLIRKGMPAYLGITYILAAPILNPVTYAATYLAFRTQPEMAYYRMGLAFVCAAAIGWILYAFAKRNPLRTEPRGHRGRDHGHGHDHGSRDHGHGHDHGSRDHGHHHDHGHGHVHTHGHHHDHRRKGNPVLQTFTHASDEFFEMGKYLVLGAFLTAVIQTFVSRQDLLSLGGGPIGSHLLMMGFAYVISLCSTSDAFIAASFSGTFPKGAMLTFMVFGPMLDFKNTLMMLATFRTRFVVRLSLLIAVVVLAASLLFETLVL